MDATSLFEILVRENAGSLLAFIRSSVSDSAFVEDIFQETLLVAWRRLDEFDKQRPFAPWLRGIASKLILAYFRTAVRKEVALEEADLEWLGDRLDQVSILPGDDFAEKLEALRQCVQQLPEHYRQPIELRYRSDLTIGELAKLLEMNIESLKKRLTRAKSQLFDCIQQKLLLAGVNS